MTVQGTGVSVIEREFDCGQEQLLTDEYRW